MFKKTKLAIAVAGSRALSGAALFSSAGLAMATPDASTAIITTLGTYAVDVGLIAVAVLTIVYGKKLVGYLRV